MTESLNFWFPISRHIFSSMEETEEKKLYRPVSIRKVILNNTFPAEIKGKNRLFLLVLV